MIESNIWCRIFYILFSSGFCHLLIIIKYQVRQMKLKNKNDITDDKLIKDINKHLWHERNLNRFYPDKKLVSLHHYLS